MKLPTISQKYPKLVLRVVMGVIFITHGIARLIYASVADFGSYLNSQGFIIGVFLAWLITFGEIIFGTLLATGNKVRYAIIFHAIVVIMGIFLIHFPNGWFVVGHGSGGVEYSLLILAVLLLLYSSESD
ncbi:MAG: DoxX family protein [Balneolaceae bacterium]